MPRSLLRSRSSQQEEMSCKNHVWMRHQNFRPQGPRIPNITELMIGSQRPLQSSLSASSLPGSDWYLNGRLWANCSQGQIRVGSIRKRIPDASKQKLSNVLVLTARDTQEKKTHAPRWVLIFPGAWGCSSGSLCFCCSEWRGNLSSWHCSVRTTYILCKPFLTEILYPSKPEAIYSISPNKSAPWLPSGQVGIPGVPTYSCVWTFEQALVFGMVMKGGGGVSLEKVLQPGYQILCFLCTLQCDQAFSGSCCYALPVCHVFLTMVSSSPLESQAKISTFSPNLLFSGFFIATKTEPIQQVFWSKGDPLFLGLISLKPNIS